MSKRRYKSHKSSRLERIERKCDAILLELTIIRKSLNRRSRTKHDTIDDAIERMHRNARRMRDEAEKDARILRKVFQCNILGHGY